MARGRLRWNRSPEGGTALREQSAVNQGSGKSRGRLPQVARRAPPLCGSKVPSTKRLGWRAVDYDGIVARRAAPLCGSKVPSNLNQGSGMARGRLPQVARRAPRLPGGSGVNQTEGDDPRREPISQVLPEYLAPVFLKWAVRR